MSIYEAAVQAAVQAALPDYEVGDEVGAGGFGVVLGGHHRAMGRRVAIKVLTQPSQQDRFSLEARVLASLDAHPHVARVYDYRVVPGQRIRLLIMEYLAGGTLTARRRAGLSPEEICAVGIAVAEALHHAHASRILHRDVKPDNILFAADGTPKVTDFGIAKILENAEGEASYVIGSPVYMAPEQLQGGILSPATDVFGLGVVLYRLLAGRLPFPQRWSVTAAVPPAPPVPEPLARVVMKALEREPAERQSTARQLALELAEAGARVFAHDWLDYCRIPVAVGMSVRAAARAASPATRRIDPREAHAPGWDDGGPEQLRERARTAGDLADAGDHLAAHAIYEDLLPRLRRVIGDDDPDTLTAMGLAAQNLRESGDHTAAAALFDDLVPRLRQTLGENEARTLFFSGEAARNLADSGSHEAARGLYQDLLPRARQVFGENHRTTLIDTGLAARNLLDHGDHETARALFDGLVPRLRQTLGENNHNTLSLSGFAARNLHRCGDRRAARALYEELLPRLRQTLGEDNHTTLTISADAALNLLDAGDRRAARTLYEDLLPRVRRVFGDTAPITKAVSSNYQRVLSDE
ncbi:serine/threonine-protein kinase [Pseudofrankia sp. BMG5.36]|uniref:serine/threonine-protein kinase n=1 Tax=Pseudofrankia sp. BMG5.36 TaxID=1834512 RepID=UPI0008DA4D0D|nr:serine/threonine-protein kinase [Pseudofrankia sp. BMG5.36]OHV45426.1 hypothetical protein BCD48_01680 [Pseudofrankia sp. BMG5.36]